MATHSSMEPDRKTSRIGDILIQCGFVTAEQLENALKLQAEESLRLGEALIKLGYLSRDRLTWALGVQFDLSYVDLQPEMINWEYFVQFPLDDLYDLRLVPMSHVGNMTTAVIADPMKPGLSEAIARLFPYDNVIVQLASEEEILRVLNEAERLQGQMPSGRQAVDTPQPRTRDLLQTIDGGQASRLVVWKSASRDERRLYGDGELQGASIPFSPDDRRKLLDQLQDQFVMEFALPGGFCGMRIAGKGEGKHAVRAVSLIGVDGWIVALEAITTDPLPRDTVPVHLLFGLEPVALKSALLSAVERLPKMPLDGTAARPPVIGLEVRVDRMVPGIFQAEIEESTPRIAVCRHLVGAVRPPFIYLEVESLDDAARLSSLPPAPDAGPLAIIVRSPIDRIDPTQLPRHISPVRFAGEEKEMHAFLRNVYTGGGA